MKGGKTGKNRGEKEEHFKCTKWIWGRKPWANGGRWTVHRGMWASGTHLAGRRDTVQRHRSMPGLSSLAEEETLRTLSLGQKPRSL